MTNPNFDACTTGRSAGLVLLENAASVDSDLTVGISNTRSITDEATSHCKLALHVDRRNCVSCRQRDDLIPSADEEGIAGDDECANPLLQRRADGETRPPKLATLFVLFSFYVSPRPPASVITPRTVWPVIAIVWVRVGSIGVWSIIGIAPVCSTPPVDVFLDV